MYPSLRGTKYLAMVSLFASLTFIGSILQIPMYPVPITLQTFFVMLSGLMLGPRGGIKSQFLYIFMGLLGIPVFSGGGGLGYILNPRFGFVLGFLVLSYVSGLARGKCYRYVASALLAGTICLYLIGSLYFWAVMQYISGVETDFFIVLKSMLIFLPGDLLKILLAIPISYKINKAIKNKTM